MIDSDRKKVIELRLKKLSKLRINAQSYNHNHVNCRDFHDWALFASSMTDPDQARNALYYGFQPLYDCLVSDGLHPSQRVHAVNTLEKLIVSGTRFLTGYYMGEPNVTDFTSDVKELKCDLDIMDGVEYKKKFRNIDSNGIHPPDILSFITQFLEHTLDGHSVLPDYIVGCACGSSEIAMPLAGLLETQMGFIRYSKRRDDRHSKIIDEQETVIRYMCNDRNVACVDDYVCTGRSMTSVMSTVKNYGGAPNGFSINLSAVDKHKINVVMNKNKFKMYKI